MHRRDPPRDARHPMNHHRVGHPMALVLIAALFVAIFVWTSVAYLRRRDPLLRDLTLIFASVSMVFVLGGLRLIMGVPPPAVVAVLVVLVVGQPYLTLRLVSRLRR